MLGSWLNIKPNINKGCIIGSEYNSNNLYNNMWLISYSLKNTF